MYWRLPGQWVQLFCEGGIQPWWHVKSACVSCAGFIFCNPPYSYFCRFLLSVSLAAESGEGKLVVDSL